MAHYGTTQMIDPPLPPKSIGIYIEMLLDQTVQSFVHVYLLHFTTTFGPLRKGFGSASESSASGSTAQWSGLGRSWTSMPMDAQLERTRAVAGVWCVCVCVCAGGGKYNDVTGRTLTARSGDGE